jgi:carboxyl-terminal processing protease
MIATMVRWMGGRMVAANRAAAGSEPKPRLGWREPARLIRAVAISLGIVVVACAGKEPGPAYAGYNHERTERLFAVGYQDIAEIYIEDVGLEELAVAGLTRLPAIDPDLKVTRQENSVVLHHGDRVRSFAMPQRQDADAWADMTADVIDTARQYSKALDTTPAARLYETVFGGVVSRLDRYSRYAGADQAQDNRAHRDGFGGIGVRVKTRARGIEIMSVMDGTPAARAGLNPGDMIVAVDGRDMTDLQRVGRGIESLRGPVETRVSLTIRAKGTEGTKQIAVKRAHIVPRTVTYRREGRAAYLRVSGFNQRTAPSLREAVKRAQSELGDDLAGYVLDLRDNPGGLLDQAVTVADVFLAKGRVVSTHGRHPDSHQYFDAEPGGPAEERPVIVLINADSASASEIVAAALKDSGRALILGSTSYGKGTVQTVLRLPNDGELTLTWARFLAPAGYALSKRGVIPNVCTSRTDARDVTDLLHAVRRGRLAPKHQSRPAVAGDKGTATVARSDALDACPANGREGRHEVELAHRLLGDRDLYKAAMSGEPARIAKAAANPRHP